jgi:3-hydroxyacyl-[acyl-carrier-protein] dehydratase
LPEGTTPWPRATSSSIRASTTSTADIHEIRRWNKQRFEMEQLTAIVHEDHGRGLCVGYKDVTRDEFWVRGHFPVMPLMPGVLMCEAAAQLSSYYTQRHNLLDAKVIGFGGMEDVRFREPVVPGDRLVIAVERVRVRPKAMIVCRFQGIVRDNIVVDGTIKGVPLPVDYLLETAAESAGGTTGS